MKTIIPAFVLAMALPTGAAAQQQPTEPGWPQPVANNRSFGKAILNQDELRTGSGLDTYRWDGEAWYGDNFDRAWFRSEGNLDVHTGGFDEAEVQGLYSRAVSPFFNVQAGVRYDFDPRPTRPWGVVGVEGMAPFFWDIGAFAFIGDGGHAAARLEGFYDGRLTQRLVLQPQYEVNVYSKSEPRRGIGSGLSDVDVGLRLRYEIRREFAPYLGVTYEDKFGRTADFARRDGSWVGGFRFVAGLRVWY